MSRLRNNGHIWIPTPELVLEEWNGPGLACRRSGWVKCILYNKDMTIAQETDWAPNMLTNHFLKYLVDYATGYSTGQYMALGDGTGTATATDTALWGTDLTPGARSSGGGAGGGRGFNGTSYVYQRYSHRFTEGVGTGSITECGIFDATTGGNMWSHFRLVDSGGSPTTIVKGADQILDVIWELRQYPTTSSGTFLISGVSYDYDIQACAFRVDATDWYGIKAQYEMLDPYTRVEAYTGQTHPAIDATVPYIGSVVGPSLFYDGERAGYAYNSQLTAPYYIDNFLQVGIDAWQGNIGSINIEVGFSKYNITLAQTTGGAPLTKTDEQRLRLRFRYTLDRV